MKKSTLPLILAAIALASVGTSQAHNRVFGIGSTDLAEYDTDGDGVLSDEELAAAKEARRAERKQAILDEFDLDGDGELNEDEKTAYREAREAERGRRPPSHH